MKILITGYKGYIGGHLYLSLKEKDHQVHGIDLKDGRDILYHLPDQNFDYVFHMAAFPSVQQSIKEPSDTFRNNAYSTSVLLEWAKKHNVKRVIFSSSAAVKGNDGMPSSPYGLQKLISEQECKLYSDLYGLDTVCLRYFNVYSKDQPYGGAYSTAISTWMEMVRLKKPLRLDGNGEQARDFVHLGDVIRANVFCMHQQKEFNGQAFDVGSGKTCSLNYIKTIIDQYHNVKWIHAPKRVGDINFSSADMAPLRKIGWLPTISIDYGIRSCFENL
jgi:UDP-glucose 4-epimerase